MNLTAVFESWHIGDGNYPPLHKGQLVNLSFEIEPKNIEKVSSEIPNFLEHIGGGEYRFCGNILKIYKSNYFERIVVVQVSMFQFYLVDYKELSFDLGSKICGEGTLLLDHYSWVEFLQEYENAPNLFYNLRVQRIMKVKIPERFIHRHESGKSLPCRLKPEDYSTSDIEELETMENESFDEEFYIVDFDGTGLEGQNIRRTFLD